ncbi:hypothetical protein [Gordonia caeni]|uniref:Uncharacterized protein n=1 Tax=Gordonia caeni TaxID=1007097 RepID=A0ABP7PQZ1_9ACTN
MSFLVAWLPFLGSCVVAVAAFAGVIKSNNTNRAAITAADAREFVRWQRESLTDLTNTITETAQQVVAMSGGCGTWPRGERTQRQVHNDHAKLAILALRLELLVGDALSELMSLMQGATWKCLQTAGEIHSELMNGGRAEDLQPVIEGECDRATETIRAFITAVRTHTETIGRSATRPARPYGSVNNAAPG